jgi:FkbM family methyltransferase
VTIKSGLRKLAPRTIRDHRILAGPLRGRLIVTSLHDYPGAISGRTEKPLLAWLQNNVKPGETWLDVGAHYGYTAIAIAELVGRDGAVFAFEPELTTAGYLNRTRTLNRLDQIKVVPFGLGEPGDLRAVSVRVDRGMADHTSGGPGSTDIWVVGFDHLWQMLGGGPVHGVKVDVQGMEAQVLGGMLRTLTEERPRLVVEFHVGANRQAILELLMKAGYRLPAKPIEPLPAESEAAYHDDHSYAFEPMSN